MKRRTGPTSRSVTSSALFRALLAGAALSLGGCAGTDAMTGVSSAEQNQGRTIAEERCASCHVLTAQSAEHSSGAPSFGDIAVRYSPASLDRELQAISEVGHYDMPVTSMSPSERERLIAFIESLRP